MIQHNILSLKQKAIDLATQAHKGQTDRAGKAYIHHPLTVAQNAENVSGKVECFIVGVLHDVIEDTNITEQDLSNEGFPTEIIDALRLVTKIDGIDYQDYIAGIKKNPIARIVKIEDLKHNMDLTRLKNPTENDYKRHMKYQKSLDFLME